MKYALLLPALMIVICFAAGCGRDNSQQFCSIMVGARAYTIQLKKYDSQSYALVSVPGNNPTASPICTWKLPYAVYHFECSDIDGNGTKDILAGVVKTTRFDSVCRKRMFIFRLTDGYIRPLWLGSRVSQPLEDFRVVTMPDVNRIRTIETEQNGHYLVAEYVWKGFGLSFVRYLTRNVSLTDAQEQLNTSTTI